MTDPLVWVELQPDEQENTPATTVSLWRYQFDASDVYLSGKRETFVAKDVIFF